MLLKPSITPQDLAIQLGRANSKQLLTSMYLQPLYEI